MTGERDPMRWVWRGITGLTLVLGWFFIFWQNRFHIDPPVVVVSLGYLAVVLAVTNLWRVGAAAVSPEDTSAEAWSRPFGERGELEREKRTLLRSIKEAEFDQAMGKLSKADADELIRMYRARAIDIIKELDRLDAGHAESPRQAIERELAARLAIEEEKAKATKGKKGKKGNVAEKDTRKPPAEKVDDAKAADAQAAEDGTPAEDAQEVSS